MKRWTFRIVLMLLLGVVTTVGVAWGCVYLSERSDHTVFASSEVRHFWPREAQARIASYGGDEYRGLGIREVSVGGGIKGGRHPDNYVSIKLVEAGWPFTALSGRRFNGNSNSTLLFTRSARRGRHSPAIIREFPLIPLAKGFILDTLLFGALWLGIILGFTAMKRALRTRPGLCPKCKYDLRGDFDRGCPECGWNRAEDE